MISMDKKYRTRDGREVRIYAVDGGGERPIHGAAKGSSGDWAVKAWNTDGTYLHAHECTDLIEVRPRIKREVWVNVYKQDDGYEFCELHTRRHSADLEQGDARIACVKLTIDCEKGEGLTHEQP